MMGRLLPLLVTLCLFDLGTGHGFAVSDEQIQSALPAAENWVAQVDAGHYDDSYLAGSTILHEQVSQTQWVEVMKTLRPRWGSVLSRKVVSHVYKPDGFAGKDGEFMVITYDTSFKELEAGMEVVVLRWEDGQWRGAGYTAGAKPKSHDDQSPDQDQDQDQSSQTDVQSETIPANSPNH